MRNGNVNHFDRQPSSEEPEFQFRGVWIPVEVFLLLRDAKLTLDDIVVWCFVFATESIDLELIAKESKLGRGRVLIGLKNLKKYGLIKDVVR